MHAVPQEPAALRKPMFASAPPLRQPARTTPNLVLRTVFSAFGFIHLLCFGALFFEIRAIDWWVCGALFVVRMFGVTGGYHRYFAHRTYKTGRVFQFLLAFLAQTSSQKGALWWAAHHRGHHKHSDTEEDTHSPVQDGFFYSHVGWMWQEGTSETHFDRIRDFAKYPELVWLNRYWVVPPFLLAVCVYLTLGWSGLFVGFFLSTVLLWHATFAINSLAHVLGTRPYRSGDDSRNNFLLALITLGEGWHNNHHYYQASTRQGFHWWQIDITYYTLKALSWVGLVWDLREPPAEVVTGARTLSHVKRLDAMKQERDVPAAPAPTPSAPILAARVSKNVA